jgi:hypothetical protein
MQCYWQGKTKNSEKDLPQFHSVHRKYWRRSEPGPPLWEAGD